MKVVFPAKAEHFRCPECGPHVRADEDGCCSTCGADCAGEPCGGHVCGDVLAAAEAELKRLRETLPACAHCPEERPAVCIGQYDSMEHEDAACDECCGHGNEDGHCVSIREYIASTIVAKP